VPASTSRPARALRWSALTLTAIASVVLVTGCPSSGTPSSTGAPASPTTTAPAAPVRDTSKADAKGDWTVFVYQAADNDLEGAALGDIVQMTKASGTQFIVLNDRAPGYSEEPLGSLGNYTDARLLRVADGEVEVLDQPGEVDMGDPGTLSSFLSGGLEKYRSDHNGLVLWDHGGGWRGVAWDDSSEGPDGKEDNLTLDELSSGIRDGLAGSGVAGLDFLGFDACLMATAEVADVMAPYATYLLASEEVEPGTGWDWSTMSVPTGGIGTPDLAQAVAKGFTAESEAGGTTNSTLSLIDLTKVGAFTDASTALADSMSGEASGVAGRIASGRSASIAFGKDPDPTKDDHLVDLGSLAENLGALPATKDAAGRLAAAVDDLVVFADNGAAVADAKGLSAYFPPTEALQGAAYEGVATTKSWGAFLRAYYTAAEGVAESDLPAFLDDDHVLDSAVSEDVDGVVLAADVTKGTGANIGRADLHWGALSEGDDSTVVFYGEVNAQVDGDTVQGTYDWNVLRVSDGEDDVAVYAALTVGEQGVELVTVPVNYYRSGSTDAERATLVLTLDGDAIVDERYYSNDSGGTAEITPEADDVWAPIMLVQDLDTMSTEWTETGTARLWATTERLQYTYDTVPGATAMFLELDIEDVVGNHDVVYYGTASPAELG